MMKCLLVVFIALVAFVAADEDWKPVSDLETFHKMHADCCKENGIPVDQLEKTEDILEVQGYVLCIAKAVGLFTEDQGYNVDRFVKTFDVVFSDVEKVRDSVEKCAENREHKNTPATWATRGFMCMVDEKIFDRMTKRREKKLN